MMDHFNQVVSAKDEANSDQELIARILRGEKECYTQIVRRYNARLFRIGLGIMMNEMDVEEAMQVAYINAYENLAKFQFKSSFSTWLTRIMINECLLRLKKKKNNLQLNDPLMLQELNRSEHDSKTPASVAVNTELKKILEESIRQLPDIYRIVFVMREIEQMNVGETQECLDISESNVKIRLNRAKAMLKESLGKYYQKEDLLHFHLSRCDRMVEVVYQKILANESDIIRAQSQDVK